MMMTSWWIPLGIGALTLYRLTRDGTLLASSRRADITLQNNISPKTITQPPYRLFAVGNLQELQPQLRHNSSNSNKDDIIIGHNSKPTVLAQKSRNETTTASATASSSSVQQLPFPRWPDGEMIEMPSLVQAVRLALDGTLHPDRVHCAYVVDSSAQLWRAQVPRPPSLDNTPFRRGNQMEGLALLTLQTLFAKKKESEVLFPHLMAAIQQGGGFAYIANYADSRFCADDQSAFVGGDKITPVSNISVPIFTLSAPVNCSHTFPVPTYETIKHSVKPWHRDVEEYHKRYPWDAKERRAVWRGAPTGGKHAFNNTRLLLCDRAAQRPDLINAKLTRTRRSGFHYDDGTATAITTHNRVVGNETRYLGEKMKMPDFQKYRAIVDVDGHSWSSRFGELLCYSSVVLKVQPSDVDYFMPQLEPWVHYIPVRQDLSDLYDRVEYAVSDAHEPEVRQIIRNANAWCLRKLNMESLILDQAGIWDRYASLLRLDQQHQQPLVRVVAERKAGASRGLQVYSDRAIVVASCRAR